jgi:hypothetical protein
MSNPKSIKQQITEAILSEIHHPSIYHELPIDQVIFKLWFTGRQEGLRLTDEGVVAFELANIEYYDHDFRQDKKSYYIVLAELTRKLKCPYYLGVKKLDNGNKSAYIRLYDSKTSMLVKLYGTIHEYLDSVKERR